MTKSSMTRRVRKGVAKLTGKSHYFSKPTTPKASPDADASPPNADLLSATEIVNQSQGDDLVDAWAGEEAPADQPSPAQVRDFLRPTVKAELPAGSSTEKIEEKLKERVSEYFEEVNKRISEERKLADTTPPPADIPPVEAVPVDPPVSYGSINGPRGIGLDKNAYTGRSGLSLGGKRKRRTRRNKKYNKKSKKHHKKRSYKKHAKKHHKKTHKKH